MTQMVAPISQKFVFVLTKFFTVINDYVFLKFICRHEWLHIISHHISRLACSYPKWLAHTEIGIGMHIHVHIHINHPKKGILDVHQLSSASIYVLLMYSCLQSNWNTIWASGRTINSCAMTVLVADYKAKRGAKLSTFYHSYICLLAFILLHHQHSTKLKHISCACKWTYCFQNGPFLLQ